MEDGYLERHYEEYEKRKAQWLKSRKSKAKSQKNYGTTTQTDTSR